MTRLLVFAQSMDAATFAAFYLFAANSGAAERNPLVLALMAAGGVELVVFVKVAVAAFVARRSTRTAGLSSRYLALRRVALGAATASGVIGAGFNLAAILHGGI